MCGLTNQRTLGMVSDKVGIQCCRTGQYDKNCCSFWALKCLSVFISSSSNSTEHSTQLNILAKGSEYLFHYWGKAQFDSVCFWSGGISQFEPVCMCEREKVWMCDCMHWFYLSFFKSCDIWSYFWPLLWRRLSRGWWQQFFVNLFIFSSTCVSLFLQMLLSSSVCCSSSSSTCCLHHFISPSPTLSSPVRSAEPQKGWTMPQTHHVLAITFLSPLSCFIFSLFRIVVFHAVIQKSLLFSYFPQAHSISIQPLFAFLITLSPSSGTSSPAFPASHFPKSCCLTHPRSTSPSNPLNISSS